MKKRTITTIICLILSVIMAFAFVACKGGGGNTDGDKDWWSSDGELEKDENGNVIFKNVSIKLETVVNGDDKDAFNMLIDRFNREYDGQIRVNVTNTGAGDYENMVGNKITQGNNAPDLLMSHQKSHKNFADNKLIQPFDEIIEKSGITINASDYADGLAKYMSAGYEGKTFSVPADGQSMAVFYNKKLLSELGKSLPTNRTELLDVLKAFKDKYNKVPIAWTTGGDYFGEYVYTSAVLQNGAKLYDETSYLTEWYSNETNRTAIHNASESIRQLLNLGYANFSEASNNALTTFLNGERLFYFTDPWSMSDLVTQYATKLGVTEAVLMETTLGGTSFAGWFAMTDNAAKNSVYGDSHFFAMAKNVTDINKKAAILTFIKWFTTKGNIGAEWAKAGHISASKVIAADDTYKNSAYVTNFVGKFYGDINNFCCIGSTPHYDAVISNIKAIFADTVDLNAHTADMDYSTIKSKQDAVNNSISFFG